jgi:hypothetical protein
MATGQRQRLAEAAGRNDRAFAAAAVSGVAVRVQRSAALFLGLQRAEQVAQRSCDRVTCSRQLGRVVICNQCETLVKQTPDLV